MRHCIIIYDTSDEGEKPNFKQAQVELFAIASKYRGKNNHNFSNNERKSHFFLFFVQKSCCVFAQFKKLL